MLEIKVINKGKNTGSCLAKNAFPQNSTKALAPIELEIEHEDHMHSSPTCN